MIVEIPIGAAALAGTMANMRSWLDTNGYTATGFKTKTEEPGRVILIQVEFADPSAGEAFRRAFGGRAAETSGVAAA